MIIGDGKNALLALGLLCLVALGVGAYYEFVYKPEQMKEPYRQAGLSEEQIDEFLRKYPEQNGNSTWVKFAKAWTENEE